eukprot:8326625-Pyramimonas_sp.AAC.1
MLDTPLLDCVAAQMMHGLRVAFQGATPNVEQYSLQSPLICARMHLAFNNGDSWANAFSYESSANGSPVHVVSGLRPSAAADRLHLMKE